MEINKSLKSEHSILLNARKGVIVTFIIFVVYIFFSTFLLGFDIVGELGSGFTRSHFDLINFNIT